MHYHIVGIAGSGMSAIAGLLLDQGHTVSGSDQAANRLTAALVARWARVQLGHSPAHVAGADASRCLAAPTCGASGRSSARWSLWPVLTARPPLAR